MTQRSTKIVLFILITLIIASCNVTKRVPKGKKLLVGHEILVNNKVNDQDEVVNQLYQHPNSKILGLPLRLTLFNWAKPKSDSLYTNWLKKAPNREKKLVALLSKKQVNQLGKSFFVSGLSEFLKKTGEPPTVYDSASTSKSIRRLNHYFYNKGFFDVKTSFKTDSVSLKKIKVKYNVNLGKAYLLDSLKTKIETPALDSLYQIKKSGSIVKNGNQFKNDDFNAERNRIATDFRNNGAFFFQENYISYELDTLQTKHKANVSLLIKNQNYNDNDSIKTKPFKLYKISKVLIFPDHTSSKEQVKIKDTISFKQFTFLIEKKFKYKPQAITNAIFLSPNSYYSDNNHNLTIKYLSNLKVFNYPTVQYKIDPEDDSKLIASIFLIPRKKFNFILSGDVTRSNIQFFGISGNVGFGIKNVFNRAETFEISLRGNLGASKDFANPDNLFFNISEFGIDSKLNFPRLLTPINLDAILPKSMIPTTTINLGFAKQTNIGLDKQNLTGSLTYNWTPQKNTAFRLDLFNIQYVKNVNVSNYFNIYKSSYDVLNQIAKSNGTASNLEIESGTNNFLNDVLGSNPTIFLSNNDFKTVRSINERKTRLTENNLVLASNITYSKTTKEGLFDENFYSFRTKFESAGNILSLIAKASKELKNQSGANSILGVEYSQYIKGEFEFIKHWQISNKQVFAVRSFTGLAIPYGNSKNIPFSRSYFSGGSNDNRAWQPYALGPGSSGGISDFNEANLKIALNAEYRFNIAGKFNGALFLDGGNIWNVFDNIIDESFKFKGFNSFKEMALGSGFGLRYDQGLFVIRGDLGFKTYNPAKDENDKWGKEINLSKAVINIGINYPF